jgi:arginine decarboxylase
MNYSVQEYANDVVAAIQDACDKEQIPHPDIVTESGRAMTAHHSVLIFDVLGVHEMLPGTPPEAVTDDEHKVIRDLADAAASVSQERPRAYHDACNSRRSGRVVFAVHLDLRARARSSGGSGTCEKIRILRELPYVPTTSSR